MPEVAPIGAISPYLRRYFDERRADRDEWEAFWDFRCSAPMANGSVFKGPQALEASRRLATFLCFYGMGRGLLKAASVMRFATALRSLATTHALQLFQMQFHEVDWRARPFTAVWQDIGRALQQIDVSPTETMRSKILIAAWGSIPALDSRFNGVFKASWRCSRRPCLADMLSLVRQRYEHDWRDEIKSTARELTHTRSGNRIPDARLIDIAFWYHGERVPGSASLRTWGSPATD